MYSVCELFRFIEQLMHLVNISITYKNISCLMNLKSDFFAHNSDQKVLGFKGFKLEETDDII